MRTGNLDNVKCIKDENQMALVKDKKIREMEKVF